MSKCSVRYEGGRLVIEADTLWIEPSRFDDVSEPLPNKEIFVGVHRNEDGERIIEYGGETICTVAEMREMMKSCDDATAEVDARIASLEAEIEHLTSMVVSLQADTKILAMHEQWLEHYRHARKRNAL